MKVDNNLKPATSERKINLNYVMKTTFKMSLLKIILLFSLTLQNYFWHASTIVDKLLLELLPDELLC